MNKKAIFIPLLLLAIQPNKILSADGKFGQAERELEKQFGPKAHPRQLPTEIKGVYRSNDIEVDDLLEILREYSEKHNVFGEQESGYTPYFNKGLEIINQFYPNVSIFVEQVGGAIKG